MYVVGFFEVFFGGDDFGGPFGIVGQQQEAFAGFVEAADGSEPGGLEPNLGSDGTRGGKLVD